MSKTKNEEFQVVAVQVSTRTVQEIEDLHNEAVQLATKSIEKAIRIGELLLAVREEFPKRASKGAGFETWVENNLPFSGRMARNYIATFKNRHLIDKEGTLKDNLLRLGSGAKKAIPETVSGMEEDHEKEVLEPITAGTWTEDTEGNPLEPKDEKKAQELASFFGIDVSKARTWVQSKKKQKPSTKKNKKAKATELQKRTLRLAPDLDDMLERVARREKKTFAEVAREMLEVGKNRFAKKHGFGV
jgi:hypothetical protein